MIMLKQNSINQELNVWIYSTKNNTVFNRLGINLNDDARINLEDLISIAGGLLPGADLKNVAIRKYVNREGATDVQGTKYIDITLVHPKQVLLLKGYNINEAV